MSDFTINDTMAEIRYELDDREIYNDIRSETNVFVVETIVDADPTYKWRFMGAEFSLLPGATLKPSFTQLHDSASEWQIVSHYAYRWTGTDFDTWPDMESYYDYSISELKASYKIDWQLLNRVEYQYVEVTNTGSQQAEFSVVVKYKYLATDKVSHEEVSQGRLSVRALDQTSIAKYGRRVMNLTWTEGTRARDMQGLVNHYLTRYKEPVAKVIATIKGHTDILRTQIITREISDIITVICANLGLNADCFINSISIRDDTAGIPVCKWGLEIQRTYETLTLFLLDTSALDGPHVLGS